MRKVAPKRYVHKLVDLFYHPRVNKSALARRTDKYNIYAEGTSEFMNINDHEIYVYYEGEPEVVLMYGWESSAHRMSTLIDKLRKKSIGFLLFDYPAHGKSSGKSLNVIIAADILKQILPKFPTIHTIVGHSFGGAVGIMILQEETEIKQLITVSSPPNYIEVTHSFFSYLQVPKEFQEKFYDEYSKYLGRNFRDFDFATIKFDKNIKVTHIHSRDDKVILWGHLKEVDRVRGDNVEVKIVEGLGHRKIMHDKEIIQYIFSKITSNVGK